MRQELQPKGFDVVEPLRLAWYHNRVGGALAVPCRDPSSLVVVVGNSSALWPPFLDWCSHHPNFSPGMSWSFASPSADSGDLPAAAAATTSTTAVLDVDGSAALQCDGLARSAIDPACFNPIDDYTMQSVRAACASAQADLVRASADHGGVAAFPGCESDIEPPLSLWSHDFAPGKMIAAQQLAAAAGVCYLDTDSYLCVHPYLGPWFSIRGAVVFDVPGPGPDEPEQAANPLSAAEQSDVKAAMASAQRLAGGVYDGSYEGRHGWEHWLAVRDAIHPNHPRRYGDDQLRYHYTKDLGLLAAAVERARAR
jgi:hypothetical protein